MNTIRFPLTVLAALFVLMIAECAYFSPLLPETVASHFDASGVANGWMKKTTFIAIIGFVTLMAVGSTASIAFLLPHMHGSMNIPNKTYWFAPERVNETMALIGSSMMWIACTVLGLLIVLNYYVCRLNVDAERVLALPMLPTLAVFLAVTGIIIVRMILKFRTTT
jgi:uncharacterized membrane protein